MSDWPLTSRGLVILVHGFNKQAKDMHVLKRELSQLGWTCAAVNLPTLFGDMDACVEALHHQLCRILQNTADQQQPKLPAHFVCHSMGGLIVRELFERCWQHSSSMLHLAAPHDAPPLTVTPGNCVFIATPHHGSRLAHYAVLIPGYKRAIKPIRTLLPDAGYKQLPNTRSFRLGLIAGNQSHGLLGNLLARPNDGHVEVSSVRAGDADDFIELPYHHKVIHHQPQTAALTHRFLTHGQWQLSKD